MQLIVATRNLKKLKEIKRLFKGLPLEIKSLKDFFFAPKIIEDGTTFKENAEKKALEISKHLKGLILGEDSGIEVKALNGQPGIYSSRFSGRGANDKKNNKKLLKLLNGIPESKRLAQYRCAVAIGCNGRLLCLKEGDCIGHIALRCRGRNGFGYDPLFIPLGYKKTFAQLSPRIKDRLSHRFKALKKIRPIILKFLQRYP